MSFVSKALPITLAAATLVAACTDASSPTQAHPLPASALSSKGASGGGGGGGGGGSNPQLIVTTPPTVNATGTWVATTDGPDVTHTYTFFLTQSAAGNVSGSVSMKTPFETGAYLVIGTTNADTLTLYVGPGTVSPGAQLSLYYRGIVSPSSTQISGEFPAAGGSPVILQKQ